MSHEDVYEVFALKYAERTDRKRIESFVFADAHDAPHPIDYFVWVARSRDRLIVIDTGFDPEEASRRGRTLLRRPREALGLIGVDAATVEDVVVTHLHYDHAGTLGDFPAARFHLQEDEMSFATGPCMCHAELRYPFSPGHVCEMVHKVYSGRVAFLDGDGEIAPNVTLHKIGGHTGGMQCVRLLTRRGWVVLASDSAHFYENFQKRKLFPIVHDARAMLEGFARLEALADSPDHIVPGHDPLVCQLYPSESQDLEGIVYRLDVAPCAQPA